MRNETTRQSTPEPPSPPTLPHEEEAEIDDRLQQRGRFLYDLHCADCHGPRGEGDGPVGVDLEPPPADLTRLSSRAEGQFPWLQTYAIIDGRQRAGVHQHHGMPVLGLRFQELDKDTNQADEIRGRILQLLHYLNSIQADAVGPDGP